MKVNDVNGIGIEQLQSQRTGAVAASEGNQAANAAASGVDVIHLSRKARLMQKASQIVAQTPEVRSEKIGPLQESIRQGSYAVDSSKVASKMITQGLFGG